MRASQAFKEEENTTIYFWGIKDNLNYYSFKIFPQYISPKYFSEGVIHLGLQLRWITPSSICLILHILLSLIH